MSWIYFDVNKEYIAAPNLEGRVRDRRGHHRRIARQLTVTIVASCLMHYVHPDAPFLPQLHRP